VEIDGDLLDVTGMQLTYFRVTTDSSSSRLARRLANREMSLVERTLNDDDERPIASR
jgi:hypothetical protein